jgi:hypothetical protein
MHFLSVVSASDHMTFLAEAVKVVQELLLGWNINRKIIAGGDQEPL